MRHLFIITTIAATLALITACSSDPTTETETAVTTDADTTAVFIMQLQRCSKLYTAEYDIRKIVTHSDEKRLKGKIFNRDFDVKMPLGDRKIAIPIDVKLKAYIDFADFSEANVVRSGEKIEVFLPDPHVVLTSSKVNHDDIREYVDFTRSRRRTHRLRTSGTGSRDKVDTTTRHTAYRTGECRTGHRAYVGENGI